MSEPTTSADLDPVGAAVAYLRDRGALTWARATETRIAELEAFVLQVRNFYFDHHNISPPPLARGADHSSPSCTWVRGAWFEMESRRLLQKSPETT